MTLCPDNGTLVCFSFLTCFSRVMEKSCDPAEAAELEFTWRRSLSNTEQRPVQEHRHRHRHRLLTNTYYKGKHSTDKTQTGHVTLQSAETDE